MAEFDAPSSVFEDSLIPPGVLAQEAQEKAELEAALAGLPVDEQMKFRSNYTDLREFRRSQTLRNGGQLSMDSPLGQLAGFFINNVKGYANQFTTVRDAAGSAVTDFGQSIVDTARMQLDPIGTAQRQAAQPAPAPSATPPAPVPQGTDPMSLLPQSGSFAPLPQGPTAEQQILEASGLIDEQLRNQVLSLQPELASREQALLQNLGQQDALQRTMSQAQSLVTPTVAINPLANASAVNALTQPSQAPATFNASTPLAQSLAPTARVESLTPALTRNARDQLRQNQLFEQQAQSELNRLQALQEQAILQRQLLENNRARFSQEVALPILREPRI